MSVAGKKIRWMTTVVVPLTAFGLLAGCSKSPANSDSSNASGTKAPAASKDITIALSNSFIGNPWRQTMVKIFEQAANDAKSKGLIKDFSTNNTAQNTATEQIGQIKSLILKKPSAILINSASPTALNTVIKQACNAGIVVITFDSVASEPCEYNLAADLTKYGELGADSVIKAMGGKGNVIVVRGVVGSQPDKLIYNGQMSVIKKAPGIKILSVLQGEASNSVTQQSVQSALPSLPNVDGVITGGSTYGALQAFEAAGKPLPFGNFSNDGTDLALWKQLKAKDPKFKAASVRPDPGQSAFALYEAIDILKGATVPKSLIMPNLLITEDTFAKWIAVTPPSATAARYWNQQQTLAGIAAQAGGKEMPALDIPSSAP